MAPTLCDDAIDAATLCLWLSQGEGFKVESPDYPGQTLLVKWKDLQDATALEIWQPSTQDNKLTPVLFGRPCSMESTCDLLEEFQMIETMKKHQATVTGR